MKKSKKFLSVLLAVCTILSLSVPAFAADAPHKEGLITPRILSEEELLTIVPRTIFWDKARVNLVKTNTGGTNGEKCGKFTADTEEVVFTLNEATNTLTYNVQLYYYDTDSRAAKHESISVGVGVSFPELSIGTTYYFKVSSLDCPDDGVNAKFTVKTI